MAVTAAPTEGTPEAPDASFMANVDKFLADRGDADDAAPADVVTPPKEGEKPAEGAKPPEGAPPAKKPEGDVDPGIAAVHAAQKKAAAEVMGQRQKLDTDRQTFETERKAHTERVAKLDAFEKLDIHADPLAVYEALGLKTPQDIANHARLVFAKVSNDPKLIAQADQILKDRKDAADAARLREENRTLKEKETARERAEKDAAARAALDAEMVKMQDQLGEAIKTIDAAKYPLAARKATPEIALRAAVTWVKLNADEKRDPTTDEIAEVLEQHFEDTLDPEYKTWVKQQKAKAAPAPGTNPQEKKQKADEKTTAPAPTLTSEHTARTTPRTPPPSNETDAQREERNRREAIEGLRTGKLDLDADDLG